MNDTQQPQPQQQSRPKRPDDTGPQWDPSAEDAEIAPTVDDHDRGAVVISRRPTGTHEFERAAVRHILDVVLSIERKLLSQSAALSRLDARITDLQKIVAGLDKAAGKNKTHLASIEKMIPTVSSSREKKSRTTCCGILTSCCTITILIAMLVTAVFGFLVIPTLYARGKSRAEL
jgi:hypothetical protein